MSLPDDGRDLGGEVGSIATVEAPTVVGQPGAWAVQHRRIGAFGQFDASDPAVVLGDGAGAALGGTGWLALEPTCVPWHKRHTGINLWL